jgi:hypothetical protein
MPSIRDKINRKRIGKKTQRAGEEDGSKVSSSSAAPTGPLTTVATPSTATGISALISQFTSLMSSNRRGGPSASRHQSTTASGEPTSPTMATTMASSSMNRTSTDSRDHSTPLERLEALSGIQGKPGSKILREFRDALAWVDLLGISDPTQKKHFKAGEETMLNGNGFHRAFHLPEIRDIRNETDLMLHVLHMSLEEVDTLDPGELNCDKGFWVLLGEEDYIFSCLCLIAKIGPATSLSTDGPAEREPLSQWLGSRGIVARVVKMIGGRDSARFAQKALTDAWKDLSDHTHTVDQSLQLFTNLAVNPLQLASQGNHSRSIVLASCDYARANPVT